MPIALADLLNERQISLQLNAGEQAGALREIVQLLAANGKIDAPGKFLEELTVREQASPSTVENGVVFPHLRTELVDEIVIGIGRSRKGVPFDGATANLIFVIGVPQRFASEYLVVVGALARLLRDSGVRNTLLSARTSAQFIRALRPIA